MATASAGRRRGARRRSRVKWRKRDWIWPIAALGAVFAAHAAVGANPRGLPLTASAVFAALAAVAVMTMPPASQRRSSIAMAIAAVSFVGVLAVVGLQLAPAPAFLAHPVWDGVDAPAAITMDRDATIRGLAKLIGIAGAFVIGWRLAADTRRVRAFYALFIAGAGVYGLAALADYGVDPDALFGASRLYHQGRLTGTFLSANTAATTFGVFAVFALARLLQAAKETASRPDSLIGQAEALLRRSPLALVTLGVSLMCLVLTASRGGVLVAFVALGALLVWELQSGRAGRWTPRRMLTVGLAVGVGALVLAFAGGAMVERLSSLSGDAALRGVAFRTHWEAFQQYPVFGQGLGTFDRINAAAQNPDNWHELHRLNAAHNTYLQWLEETGVLGAAAMLVSLLAVHLVVISGLVRRRRMRSFLRAQIAASALIAGHAMFDYALEVPSFALQWSLLLGVAAGFAIGGPAGHTATRKAPRRTGATGAPRPEANPQ